VTGEYGFQVGQLVFVAPGNIVRDCFPVGVADGGVDGGVVKREDGFCAGVEEDVEECSVADVVVGEVCAVGEEGKGRSGGGVGLDCCLEGGSGRGLVNG
jgi:hypothetical protein